MIRILEKMNIWSVDTSTWRVKAAFGHVIIPGLGERYVGNRKLRFRTPRARKEEIELLYKELEKTKFPLLDQFEELLNSFIGRAIINAWVILKTNNGINKRSNFIKLYEKLNHYNAHKLFLSHCRAAPVFSITLLKRLDVLVSQ